MSADDSQTMYATFAESIFQSAVAEATKLFETMVNELKAEISRIRKENEALKARCSEFESMRSNLTECTRETGPLRNDGSEKRDTAVQCDLVASCTLLVEQSQPLSFSQLQNPNEGVVYALREHDYVTRGDLEMEITFIKQESDVKQEEVESAIGCGHDLSDKAGPFINTPCPNGEIPLSERHEEDQIALALPFSGRYDGLQGPEEQSSEPRHSLVISLPEVKQDMDEESEIGLKISEISTQYQVMEFEKRQFLIAQHQSEVETSDKEQPSVVSPQCEGQTSINEQTNVTLQQYGHVQSTQEQLAQPAPLDKGVAYDDLSNQVPGVETSSQPEVVRRRRGRPPKKAKCLQRPVEEIRQPLSSEVPTEKEVDSPQVCPVQTKESSTIISPLIQERENGPLKDVANSEVVTLDVSVVSQLSMNRKEGAVQAPSSIVSAAETTNTPPSASPQETSVLTTECSTSVTLQDAMLLLEAMNQSVVENVSSSLQRTATPHGTQCGPRMGPLEIVDEVSAQTTAHPFKTHENEDDLSRMELSTTTQLTKEKLCAPPQPADVTPASEVFTLKQQHTHSQATATTSSMSSPTQTGLQSPQQQYPHPLITSVAPSRQDNTLPVPRVSSSNSAQTQTQQPAVVSTGSTPADLPLGTPSLSSVAEETYVASSKVPPVVTQSATESTDLPTTGTLRHPEMKTIIPRLEYTEASRKKQSQIIVLTPQPDPTKSLAPSTESSRQLSSSQESNISGGAQITILSQKRPNAADGLESPKKPASVSGIHAHTESCSSLNMSVWHVQAIPPAFVQKLSCEVRLARLPFPISTKDSVFVPRLPTNASWDSRFTLKEGTIQEKSTSDNISTQPDICPGSKETSVAMSVHTPVTEEPNDIQEKSSLSSENVATLEELPDNGFVQTSTPCSVSQPAFEKSAMAVNATGPSAVSGTADELTSNVDKEIISIVVHDCSFPEDGPIGEKEPATLLHSSSIKSEDTSNPNSQPSEPSSVSYRMRKAKCKSSPANPSRGSSFRGSVGSKDKKSSFGSPRRCSSRLESFACKKTQNVSAHPRRTSSARHEMNTKKLTKAKNLAKMRNSNRANHEAGKKCTTTAVWFPPEALPAAEKEETQNSQDHPVNLPSVPLPPVPYRAPPVVSPLQPLSVIGGFLLRNQCGVCGRILSSSAALQSHVSLHKGLQPFSCSLCGKSYTDSKGLKRHGRVHRNGKIHVCQQCGKGFVYKFSLAKHIEMVHRKFKRFVCQFCNKGFFTKKDVEIHIRVHTGEKPFHCNLCERKFSRRTDLNLHLRWHNGEKRHWCPYCGKGFLDSNNLKRHKYTHTGEKPHPCPHCPKRFSQSGHLKKHVKNVHRHM